MEQRDLNEKRLTLPQVKKILDSVGEDALDQFQRRTLDYVSKLSKVNNKTAEKLLKKIVHDFQVDEADAVQIVNCMPESVEELRVFLAGGRKIVEPTKLEAIVKLLDETMAPK